MSEIKTTMSQRDFFNLRTSLGLTRPEAADVLNVSLGTLLKWEGRKKGGLGPHPTSIVYLQFIANNPDIIPPFWPERLMEDGDV